MITSSTSAGSRLLRSARATRVSAESRPDPESLRRPLRLPIGVRTASTITAISTGNSCASERGDDRTRTDDPLVANQVLSQLSYVPLWLEVYRPAGHDERVRI